MINTILWIIAFCFAYAVGNALGYSKGYMAGFDRALALLNMTGFTDDQKQVIDKFLEGKNQ